MQDPTKQIKIESKPEILKYSTKTTAHVFSTSQKNAQPYYL